MRNIKCSVTTLSLGKKRNGHMTARQSAMTVSLSAIKMPSASRNNSFILCPYRWGVAHLLSPLSLALHCHIVRLYLPRLPHIWHSILPKGASLWRLSSFILMDVGIINRCISGLIFKLIRIKQPIEPTVIPSGNIIP